MNKLFLGFFQVIMGEQKVAREEENAYGKNTFHNAYLPPGVNPGW
jgi:hypothetical protein